MEVEGKRLEEASREGGRQLLQWPRRACGGRGGKGDRRGGGGAGRPQKPLRPPQHNLDGKPWRTGEAEPPAAGGMWREGPGAQGEAQRKPSHWGECRSVWGETRMEMAEGDEGGKGGPGSAEAVLGEGGQWCGLAASEMGTEAEVETQRRRVWTCGGRCGLPPPERHPGLGVPRPRRLAPLGCAGAWLRGCGLAYHQCLEVGTGRGQSVALLVTQGYAKTPPPSQTA